MSWSPITSAEVLQEFTPSEKAVLDNIQGKDAEEATNLDAILLRSVNKFRGAISAGGQSVSTTAATIPDDIRDDVIAHARWKFLVALPQARVMQTAERKAAHDEALKVIEGLRTGKLRVEDPGGESQLPGIALLGSHTDAHPFDDLGTT